MSEQQENTANDLGDYSLDDEDQLQPEDTLDQEDVDDVLDRGYSPPEQRGASLAHGATAAEQHQRRDDRPADPPGGARPRSAYGAPDNESRPGRRRRGSAATTPTASPPRTTCSATARSATCGPAGSWRPTRAHTAPTTRRTWSARTSASTVRAPRPRRPRCTSSRSDVPDRGAPTYPSECGAPPALAVQTARMRVRSRDLPKAHLHLHFTGSMRVETVRDLAEQARHPPARRPDDRLAAAARARATSAGGSASSGCTTRPGPACATRPTCAGSCARRRRTTPPRGRAGWRSRSTRRRTRRSSAASPRPWRSCSTRPAAVSARSRHPGGGRRGREPDPAPAGRPHAGPAGRPARRRGAGHGRRVRAEQRRAARASPRSSRHAFAIARRAGLALRPARRRAARRRRRSRRPSTRSRPDRLGHGVRSVGGPAGAGAWSPSRGVALEVCPGSNVALGVYASRGRGAAAHDRGAGIPVALGRRRPAAVRLAAGRRSTSSARDGPGLHRRRAGRAWPAGRCGRAGPRSRCARPPLDDIDAWLAAHRGSDCAVRAAADPASERRGPRTPAR